MKLILLFNGWGMDSNLYEIFSQDYLEKIDREYDLLFINYPYTISKENCQSFSSSDSDFDFFKGYNSKNLLDGIEKKYEKIFILGWSFGVYYANLFLQNNPEFQKYDSVAINGTPEIIGKNGISEKMIRFTMENLTPASLEKFYKNMGGTVVPETLPKDISSLKKELQYLLNNYKTAENFFRYALIGEKDRIVPSKNIERYFNLQLGNSKIKKVLGDHFIFSSELSIIDIIRMLEDEIQ